MTKNARMAHWGKAMSLYEQLWEFPDDKQLKEGHEEIELAQELAPQTAKGAGFLTAAAVFYQENAKMTHSERIKAYSQRWKDSTNRCLTMWKWAHLQRCPCVALAEEEDVDSLANQKKAIAILNPLFEKYPDHPGVAHYLIHAATGRSWRPRG